MHRTINRVALIFGILMTTWASGAWAESWKTIVKDAGGFWAGNAKAAGWNKILHTNPNQFFEGLPGAVGTMLKKDVEQNTWIQGHAEMKRKLGPFRPEAQQVFTLPYVPIPADKMNFKYEDQRMSASMKEHTSFSKNGKRYVRYFFHPLYADRYKELIEHYGVVYDHKYKVTPSSSPRSLVGANTDQMGKPFWVKVSLHAQIDHYVRGGKKIGILRTQTPKKAKRSSMVNEAFRNSNEQDLSKHKILYMPEPASYVPGKIPNRASRFDVSTIFREIPSVMTNPSASTRWIPAFDFIKNMKANLDQVNRDKSGRKIKPIAWVTKGLIEPLVRTYLYLGIEHGLQGELHTQNFLLETNRKGVPTGRVMVKDLDGFRMDLDMRIRNGRKVGFLSKIESPFYQAMHGATQGTNNEPAALHSWFNRLIRNVNGFTQTREVNGQEKTFYATPAGMLMVQLKKDYPDLYKQLVKAAKKRDPSLDGDKAQQRGIEQVFDVVAKAQFQRITGIKMDKYPQNWSYKQDKGLNGGMLKLRKQLHEAQPSRDGGWNTYRTISSTYAQQTRGLGKDARLKVDKRFWTNGTPKTAKVVGDGVIQLIHKNGRHVGYVLPKNAEVGQRDRAQTHLSRYTRTGLGNRTAFGHFFRNASSSSSARSARTSTTRARRTR